MTLTKWDNITARAGWAMLVLFTVLSSYLNARRAMFDQATIEAIVLHAAIPVVLLLAGLFAETVALAPAVHRPAKWTVVTTLFGIFTVTMIASYLAILAVITAWNPHAPGWVNAGLASVPDAVMLMAGTVVLSLRVRRHGVAEPSRTRAPSPWRRLPDALAARAEAALAVPVHRGGAGDTDPATSDDARIAAGASPESAAVHRDDVSRDGDTDAAVRRDTPVRLAVVPRDTDPRRVAEQVVAEGRTTAPLDVVERVLTLLADGVAQRAAADQVGLSVSAVSRIVKAAREVA